MSPPRRFPLVLAISLLFHLAVVVPLLVAALRERPASSGDVRQTPIRVRVVTGPRQTSTARRAGPVPRSSGAPNHTAISSPAIARRRSINEREPRSPVRHRRRTLHHQPRTSVSAPSHQSPAAPSSPSTATRLPTAPAARPAPAEARTNTAAPGPKLSAPVARTKTAGGARFAAGTDKPQPRRSSGAGDSSPASRPPQRATLPELGGARSFPSSDSAAEQARRDAEARDRAARLQGERDAAAREAAEREAAQREQRLGEERARLNRERQEQLDRDRLERERLERERREREKREKDDREKREREARERDDREKRDRQAREDNEREQRERRDRERREQEARQAARPKGPTRDAEILSDPRPNISEEMAEGASRRSVTVRFRISSSGDASASISRSSGSSSVDARVLASCNRWRFRPALRNGEPRPSTLRLRVDF